MAKNRKLRVALITGLNNRFIVDLISRFNSINEIVFTDVIFWYKKSSPIKKLKKNIKKHGMVYIPYRFIKFVNDIFVAHTHSLLERMFLIPKIEEDLFAACSTHGINVHKINEIHSNDGIDFFRSLNCDILAVCGTGILKQSVFGLPAIGTINLHQGKVPKYRGAPPGFWELWNDEKEVGVTIHFVDEGVDTGDIILQKVVPIFNYDDLSSTQQKLNEVALSLYPEAIRQIATETNKRIKQTSGVGKQYLFPTLKERLHLFYKIKKHQFNTYEFLKGIAKKIFFTLVLFIIWLRDLYLRKKGGNTLSVLYYHRVTDVCQDGMTIDVESFEKQIRFLKNNYQILSAKDLKDWIDEKTTIKGKKGCLITFDDGYEDNYINALPILQKYACSAIYFVSTGLIGNEKQFEHDNVLYPRLTFKHMTWKQLQNAINSNIEIGIHTDTHANLGKVSFQTAINEIEASIEKHKTHFGNKSIYMSYPFGQKKDITQDVVDYIRNHKDITALFSAYGGKNISPIDKYDIKRINVGIGNKGLIFWYYVQGGLKTLTSLYDKR